jgi:hypothetical protein
VSALISKSVACPYCGELCDIEIDPSGGASQSYEEDCQVCCRPWSVRVKVSGNRATVKVSAQDETAEED